MNTDTSYLGLRLPHPFIAGASPFGYSLDRVKRLEDAGCAAVVLHSLFEEQLTYEQDERIAGIDMSDRSSAELFAQFPEPEEYPFHPDGYCEHIRRLKRSVAIPVIASLNGRTKQSWLKFATTIEQAGADALEVNMYQVITDLNMSSAQVEAELIAVVEGMKRLVRIPVAVKLAPFYTAFANVAHRLDGAGADGLVLFNRFYQPDIDIRQISVHPQAELSTSAELLTRLRWVAILHGRVRPSLAVSGGVATPADGIKALLAGADVVQMVSALLRHGPAYIGTMRKALEEWLEWHGAGSLQEFRGRASLRAVEDPGVFERAQYIRTLHSWTR